MWLYAHHSLLTKFRQTSKLYDFLLTITKKKQQKNPPKQNKKNKKPKKTQKQKTKTQKNPQQQITCPSRCFPLPM